MLRYVIGDSLYFADLKSYASDTAFKFKNAVTTDFIAKTNQVTGQNLDWFFEEWIFLPNHPLYQNSTSIEHAGQEWKLYFIAKQIQSNPPFFKMPIVLKFIFSGGSDSLVRVMNDTNNQTFIFTFGQQPLNIIFDPDNDIVLKKIIPIGVKNISTEIPSEYQLFQNYPNPFNASTIIKFDLPKAGQTKIVIYNVQGQEIDILVSQKLDAGSYKTEWNADNYPSGVYFFRIESGSFIETKKMVLVK
jgi:hypothetical protein